MAQNPFGTLSPEEAIQLQGITRQQQLANLLMQQGMQAPQGQIVSGRYVPPSIFQNLAGLANIYVGKKLGEESEQKQLDLAQKLREGREVETKAIMEKLRGTPAVTEEMAGPYAGNVPPPVLTKREAVAPDIQGAMDLALRSRYGAGQALLPTLIQRSLPEPVKPTTDMQNYNFAKEQGFKGSFTDFKNQMTPFQQAELALAREKFEFDKTQRGAGKDLTEAQGKASAFQSQMVSASNAIKTLQGAGFDPTSFKSQTQVRLAGGVVNPAIPAAAQQYKQAQDQWSEAYLRFKTGAAATEQEVQRNVKTFFPQFGDKPEQIAQKAAMREQAERDIGIAAGRGAGLGAQPIAETPTAKPEAKPAGMPSQSAIDAELKRRGLK